ncbi:MAG: hypothetical protein BGO77_03920 [Caedibacter sp. 37-49]|nr:MAG: hypothetical protein BGO77_03920 [Caedibacter sp. 37-49]
MKKYHLIISSIWALTVMDAYAGVTTDKGPNRLDISSYVKESQEQIKAQQNQLNKLGIAKGHDENVNKVLIQASQALDTASTNLKQLDAVKKLPRAISSQIATAQGYITAAENVNVSAPKSYPERCLVLTLDEKGREKATKEGLNEKIGFIETFGGPNTWVLTTVNPTAKDGVDRHHLDAKVGMIGSSDPSSGMLVRGRTPKDMIVHGWVNKEGKVLCVSKATSGKPQN